MDWKEVCEHPSLQDLPFKIETNEWGEIVMTPATGRHGKYQILIAEWIAKFKERGSQLVAECPIQTTEGVKVADVAWGSIEFFKRNRDDDTPYPESPEIVVEIRSPSNTAQHMERKKRLYFERGAKEVWFCDGEGNMHFFNPQGELERSELFKEFPERIEIYLA